MDFDEDFILYELSDKELNQMTGKDIMSFCDFCEKKGVNEAMTVKGLLKKEGLKYGDLTPFAQNYFVGVCNNANRTENQIYINRKGSELRTNIVINLNENRGTPYLTHQIQVNDSFVHEEAYDENGLEIYRS